MKKNGKLLKIKMLGFVALIGVFASACTTVYFKKPVPQSGSDLQIVPASWAGVYIETPEPGQENALFKQCIRLERVSDSRLLLSEETRIHENDIDKWRQDLEEQKRNGTLTDFLLTDRFLFATVRVDDKNKPGVTAEQQITYLFKQGSWYVVGQSAQPLVLFDLKSATETKFEVQRDGGVQSSRLPAADSLSTEILRLVARQKNNRYYLNLEAKEDSLWELYYVEQPSADELVIKTSEIKNKDQFVQRMAYYNAITPFAESKSGTDYIIDPTDRALEQLLADDDLLQVTRLHRISDN